MPKEGLEVVGSEVSTACNERDIIVVKKIGLLARATEWFSIDKR